VDLNKLEQLAQDTWHLEPSGAMRVPGILYANADLVSINSDAHSIADFDNLRFGVGQARRGWLEKKDVLNTRPLAMLRTLLAATR